MIEIEKDIPLPADRRGPRGDLTIALEAMLIGDSILVSNRPQASVSAAARNFGKPRGWAFTTRSTSKGVRLWRTS